MVEVDSPSVHPDERTAKSRKHRKTVFDQHATTMRSSLGMRPLQLPSLSHVAVVTSHPILVQDTFENVYDVGVYAENLDGVSDGVDWQQIFDGCKLVIVAIEYRTPETRLNHSRMLFELESFCDATGCSFLMVDDAQTRRWEDYPTPQVPYINELGLAYVCNNDDLISAFGDFSSLLVTDGISTWDFCQWLEDWSAEQSVVDSMSVAFPAAVQEDEAEDQEGTLDVAWSPDDLARSYPVEDLIAEGTLLDDVGVPGLPETERRRASHKLPQRVRIAVRRLHRAFGHIPKVTMVNLLRAAKIKKQFAEAARLHRCDACERTAPKRPTHKASLPHEYTFNSSVGLDLLEITNTCGEKYQVFNMVRLGTCFQQAEVIKIGAGQASTRDCLNSFIPRWVAWAGVSVFIVCDRGLHNRGVFQQYMDEHGIQVDHVPLESPESLGRTERHGGLLKAMHRRVASEVGAIGREQVEQCLNQVLMVKNDSSRVGGFSPAQWVRGRAPRGMSSVMSEEQFAELGAIEARHDPSSIFSLQHMARIEAQKAYVHLDCSRRVQRALTKNASVVPREFSMGDLVTFQRDNHRGHTSWSPTSRVIGHEGPKNLWLLCGNVPVLVVSQNVRIASPSEALAQAVLKW